MLLKSHFSKQNFNLSLKNLGSQSVMPKLTFAIDPLLDKYEKSRF